MFRRSDALTDLEVYFDNTQKPWGRLFYDIVWEQLSFAKSLKILDFGSGFGITANHMASFNEVLAIEPNEQMCKMGIKNNEYSQIIGGIESLNKIPKESYDLIICHNVLEYVDKKDDYISAFSRLLKLGGKLSLIKHNHTGRVMQKAVFENNIELALQLINGETAFAQNFGEIKYYGLLEIDGWINSYNLKLIDNLGIRTFYALHPDNSVRENEKWIKSMYELELRVSRMKEFIDIAFFNHVIFEKVSPAV